MSVTTNLSGIILNLILETGYIYRPQIRTLRRQVRRYLRFQHGIPMASTIWPHKIWYAANGIGSGAYLPSNLGHSKLMQVLWTKSLQRLLDEDPSAPIVVISVHPGGVDTFTHTWPFPRISKWVVGLTIATPEIGAYNSLFAAASKKVSDDREKYKGAYLESQPTGKFSAPHRAALDERLRTQLWTLTEAFLISIGI